MVCKVAVRSVAPAPTHLFFLRSFYRDAVSICRRWARIFNFENDWSYAATRDANKPDKKISHPNIADTSDFCRTNTYTSEDSRTNTYTSEVIRFEKSCYSKQNIGRYS